MVKLNNFLDGNWHLIEFLFQYEHPVPFLHYKVAAVMGTTGELVFPIMILLGLGTRLGALGLLMMSIIIEVTYLHNITHIMWIVMSMYLFLYSSGKVGFDHFIMKRINQN